MANPTRTHASVGGASSPSSLAEKHDSSSLEKGAHDFSNSGQQSVVSTLEYTAEEERRVLRKVGNAKLLGLMKDIGMADQPEAYNTSLALYFLGYVLFEIPANIVLKKFSPRVWLPSLTIAWGVTATLQALIKDEAGFYAARFFMGVSEAGLFPGVIFVFSMYYKRKERTLRCSLFFGGAALAGSFGGILAWGLGHINGGGLKPWGWLFAIEGMFTVLVGISAYFWVPGFPRQAKFLSEREHAILIARLQADGDSGDEEPFSWQGVWDAFKDPFVNAYGWLFHCFAMTLYSLSLFLPTIIAQLGFANWRSQLMTVPVYFMALVGILFFVWFSHKINQRGTAIAVGGAIAIIGYIILLTTHTPGARYAGTFFAVIGIYASNALLLAWPSENVSPQTKRAVASGMQIFIGDVGAIAGVLIYRPSLASNFYRTPHGIAILYTGCGILLALGLSFAMHRANKSGNVRRAARREGKGEEAKGDRARGYLFQI
ncbi:hypothetical protein Rhopal_005943-T1 [Rhodotorula paludigena]|uniref:Major facilitator superfamily (MFS) profile domain-containing protein n=1 Tax=Rhodotorula paludigena TaxID=86838 RepID=A0AAV5GWE8_9BASI|nr:hypothetical protein Rhopal_005943-T1 [Rhodotorula paludigena]